MKKPIEAFKHFVSTWSNNRHMKKLRQNIEKRFIDAGFSRQPDVIPGPDESKLDTKTKGAKAPFFMVGEFDGNQTIIEVVGAPVDYLLDQVIKIIQADSETHFLHAIREKKKSRVTGKKLLKHVLICEYKPIKQTEDEEII